MKHPAGVSLVELLIAIFMLTLVAATLSSQFPSTAKNILMNRQSWQATHLASSQIASFQNQLYASVDTTDTTLGHSFNGNCDCTTYDFSEISSTITQTAGTTFTVASCINFVTQTNYTAQCAGSGDTGIKNIFVRVSWGVGASSRTVTQGSSITAS